MVHNWYDVCSDLSAFHRIDDPESVHPQRLIDLAVRLPAYAGVVTARARAEESTTVPAAGDGVRYVDPTTIGVAGDPVFGSVFDFGTGEVE